jgi:quercetin dioxygenase-like cupin family protein
MTNPATGSEADGPVSPTRSAAADVEGEAKVQMPPGSQLFGKSTWEAGLLPLERALLLVDLANTNFGRPGAAESWEPFLPGVDRCWLYCVSVDGPAAALLRFKPGACVPLHEHRGYEHIFVLRGEQSDENGVAAAGALLIHPPGTRHRVVSVPGCLVLAIYEKPVRFIEPLSKLRPTR